MVETVEYCDDPSQLRGLKRKLGMRGGSNQRSWSGSSQAPNDQETTTHENKQKQMSDQSDVKVPLQSELWFSSCSSSWVFECHCVESCLFTVWHPFPHSWWVCDITNSLEADPSPRFSQHKCDVDTENGLYCDLGDILCPAVKLVTTIVFQFISFMLTFSYKHISEKCVRYDKLWAESRLKSNRNPFHNLLPLLLCDFIWVKHNKRNNQRLLIILFINNKHILMWIESEML